ncbi:hypothetical protein [Bacillus toyonensis]|nr:hypothetical protein [Bacillus toyonensis]
MAILQFKTHFIYSQLTLPESLILLDAILSLAMEPILTFSLVN